MDTEIVETKLPPSMRSPVASQVSPMARNVSFGETKKVYEYDESISTNLLTQKLKTWFAPIIQPVVNCGAVFAPEDRVDAPADEARGWDFNTIMCGGGTVAEEEPRDEIVEKGGLEVTVENVLEYETLKEMNLLPADQLQREFYKQADVLCKLQRLHGSTKIQAYEKEINALKQYLEHQQSSASSERVAALQGSIQERMAKTIEMVKAASAAQEQIETDFEFSRKQATQKKSTFSVVEKDAAEDLVKPPPLQSKMRLTKREATAEEANMAAYKTPDKYLNDDAADASEEPVECLERPKHGRRPPALTTATRLQYAFFGTPPASPDGEEPETMDVALQRAWNEINELVADLKFSLMSDEDEVTALENATTNNITTNSIENTKAPEAVEETVVGQDTEFAVTETAPRNAVMVNGEASAKSRRSISASVKAAARALLRRSVKSTSENTSVLSGVSKNSIKSGIPAFVATPANITSSSSVKGDASVAAVSVVSAASASIKGDVSIAAASVKEEASINSVVPESVKGGVSVKAASVKDDASVQSAVVASVKADTSVKGGLSVTAASVKDGASVKSAAVASVKADASVAACSVKSATNSVKSSPHSVKSSAHSVKSSAHSVKSSAKSVKSDAKSVKSAATASEKGGELVAVVAVEPIVASTEAGSVVVPADASVKSSASVPPACIHDDVSVAVSTMSKGSMAASMKSSLSRKSNGSLKPKAISTAAAASSGASIKSAASSKRSVKSFLKAFSGASVTSKASSSAPSVKTGRDGPSSDLAGLGTVQPETAASVIAASVEKSDVSVQAAKTNDDAVSVAPTVASGMYVKSVAEAASSDVAPVVAAE